MPFLGNTKLARLTVESVTTFRNDLINIGRPQTKREASKQRTPDGRVPVSRTMAKRVVRLSAAS